MNELRAIFSDVQRPSCADGLPPDGRRVAFVCLGDARDPHYSSGSPYGMRKGFIDVGCDVVDILSVQPRREALYWPMRAAYRLAGRHYLGDRSPMCLSAMAREIGRQLEGVEPDLIFAAHSIPLSRVSCNVPRVLSHDQTFVERQAYQPFDPRPLAKRYVAQAIAQEREAFAGVTLCVYPSERSIRSLRDDYGVAEEKMALVPWGGNLPIEPERAGVDAMILSRSRETIHLLFIGVDWERKGGDMVLATAATLAARGRSIKLTLVGCEAPCAKLPDYVELIRFIDKRQPEGLERLLGLLASSHFLFVPSRAEAFGHVFCEAAALGVPSIACDVGGIPTIINDGENGHRLPPAATAEEFADVIERSMADADAYHSMARAARRSYEERLNWSAFARSVLAHVDALAE